MGGQVSNVDDLDPQDNLDKVDVELGSTMEPYTYRHPVKINISIIQMIFREINLIINTILLLKKKKNERKKHHKIV